MALGILDQLGLAASLVFAIPVALYGLQRAAAGDAAVGAAFLVVAALMVYLPQRLTTPGDIPGKAAEKAVSKAVGAEGEGAADGADEADGTNGGTDGSDTDVSDDERARPEAGDDGERPAGTRN